MGEYGNEVKKFFMELQKNYQILGTNVEKGIFWLL
jgi:hypothetical protein